MHNNPVTRGLVTSPGDWPWSSWPWFRLGWSVGLEGVLSSICALAKLPVEGVIYEANSIQFESLDYHYRS